MNATIPSGDGSAGGRLPTVADRPPAARRWLTAAIHPVALPTGDEPGPTRLHVRGSICRVPGGRWMDWEGHQSFEVGGLGFHWQARMRLGRLAWVDAEDRLDAEGGYSGARLLGFMGWNVGCIEAAVTSGINAAAAVEGEPES